MANFTGSAKDPPSGSRSNSNSNSNNNSNSNSNSNDTTAGFPLTSYKTILWLTIPALDDREVPQQMIQKSEPPSAATSASVLASQREIIMSFASTYPMFSFCFFILYYLRTLYKKRAI